VCFWGGVLSRTKRAQDAASFRPGPFAFDDPGKLTDGRGGRVFAATGGGYLR